MLVKSGDLQELRNSGGGRNILIWTNQIMGHYGAV